MKQINDLIVLSVPKNSEAHEIIKNFDSQYCQWQIGKAHGIDKLPPGKYEIIGTLDDLCNGSTKKDKVIKAARHPNSVLTSLLLTHGIISMTPDINKPERQLLFIHKLK